MAAIIGIVLVAALGIAIAFARFNKAHSILEDWARDRGYRLLEAHRRDVFRGPYLFGSGELQVVYRITIEDGRGQTRSGYARVGGFFAGLLSEQVSVKWDE